MFDIGWTEIIIVMGIALEVVGPKEMPKIVRTIGKWRGKARAYARDFHWAIEDAADVSELDEIKKEIAEANRELNEAKRDLGDQAAELKGQMNQAAKDSTFVKLNSDGSVSEPGAQAPQKGNGGARPEGADGDKSGDGSSENAIQKPGESQENSANA